jgi:hypothetical protein
MRSGENELVDYAVEALLAACDGRDPYLALALGIRRYGPSRMPEFIDLWLQAIFGPIGKPDENRIVSLALVDTRTGVYADPEGVHHATVWAGRLAAAWVAGDIPTLKALMAVPTTDAGQVVRAVEILRGIVHLVAEAGTS